MLLYLCFLSISTHNSFAKWSVDEVDDDIYLANGNKLKGKLIKADESQVYFTVTKGGRKIPASLSKENILFVFNSKGNYLTISSLPSAALEAQNMIDEFNNSSIRASGYDLIIKAIPLKVIACKISYESDALINYKLSNGEIGSINKNDIVSVLYGDGRHQFIMNPSEAAALMKNSYEDVIKFNQKQDVPPPPVAFAESPKALDTPVNTITEVKTEQTLTTTNDIQPKTEQVTISTPTPEPTKPSLNEEEYQQYRTKAIQRVDEFGNYLNIITDKSLDGKEREKAIEQVVKMFLPNATIEVTTKDKPGSKKYKVRDYLTRMKLLPYSSAKVSWSEIQYVSELKQEADGNYYGTITGQQTFMGYGGTGGTDVLYSDVTQKNVKVKLQSYQKVIDGQNVNNWDVLLGNIGVAGK